jgi:uncharacterized membrane protein YkoI
MPQGAIPRSDGNRGRAAIRRPALLLSLIAIVSAMVLALPAHAGKKDKDRKRIADSDEPRREAPGRCPGFSLDEAIASIERRHKARVVKANVVQDDGRCVYELRLLSDEGRVWTVRVDSRTGN